MIMHTPDFWYKRRATAQAYLLLPLAYLLLGLGAVRAALMKLRQKRVPLPVIAIGNITAGGTGKTPMVAALARIAKARGMRPVILMRGYGGRMPGPVLVDDSATPEDVGDEAVMLHRFAKAGNIVVAHDRAKGAAMILQDDLGDIIIMDDAMQNHAIFKDRTIACFNGRLGMGNGLPQPAGPLRELPHNALDRVDAVAISGADLHGMALPLKVAHPNLSVSIIPRKLRADALAKIKDTPVIAFAGIGDAEGFFAMLKAAGVRIAGAHAFPDHAVIDDATLLRLRDSAKEHNAVLVTTEKDAARIGAGGDGKTKGIHVIGLDVHIPEALVDLVMPHEKSRRQ